MATPEGQKQAYFPAKKEAAILLLIRIIKHVQHLTTLPHKVYILSNLIEHYLSVHEV